uniref:Uncharacterized protein n=1 Tax=Oryza nivara TaxID=4536 RepID=A0A0E0I2R5_ORYNI
MPARQLSPALQADTRAVAAPAQPPACARLAIAGRSVAPPVAHRPQPPRRLAASAPCAWPARWRPAPGGRLRASPPPVLETSTIVSKTTRGCNAMAGYNDDDDSYPSRRPINLDDRARHGDSGDGRPSLFSSAFKQEESAKGWGVVVEERGASAIGEVASVVMPGWFGHDRSAVDDDGNELGTTGSGDSFAPFF